MENFPASIFMTDFEIVEIENEYIREQLEIAQQQRIRQLQREKLARIAKGRKIRIRK